MKKEDYDVVTGYRCKHCKRVFINSYQHTACKKNPNVIHCGDCKHYIHYAGHVDWEGEFEPAYYRCAKDLKYTNIPRKEECAGFERKELSGPFDYDLELREV